MFMDLAKTLRSLTASPITTALDQAHKMARRHLEHGGATLASRGPDSRDDYLLPLDIDLVTVDAAIDAKLRGGIGPGRGNRLSALHVDKNGKVLVPAEHVRRLGDGAYDRGWRWLDQVIRDIRADPAVLTAAGRAGAAHR